MKKIAVVIPFHTHPEVLKLTLGTLFRATPKEYDLNIHVGIHSNYNHYYFDGMGFFDELRKYVQFHMVDEIDWMGEYYSHWFRYSVMHAKNLVNLFKAIRFYEFDYLLILDNDLYIKQDFLTPCFERFPDAELIGSYFGDRQGLNEVRRELDLLPIYILPKLSGWHVLLSRKLYLKMADDYSTVYPRFIEGDSALPYLAKYDPPKALPVFCDVMGEFLFRINHIWNLKFGVVPSEEFAQWIHHFTESSFNFGRRSLHEKYFIKIAQISEQYKKEFPNGLEGLR